MAWMLAANASFGLLWWVGVFAAPWFRRYFIPGSFPDASLFSFFPGDLVLFCAAGLAAAYGLQRAANWAWPVLLLHTGAAFYAACYALTQWMLTGEAALAAIGMAPSLILLPYVSWASRPR